MKEGINSAVLAPLRLIMKATTLVLLFASIAVKCANVSPSVKLNRRLNPLRVLDNLPTGNAALQEIAEHAFKADNVVRGSDDIVKVQMTSQKGWMK